METALIYTRVSSEKQAKEGHGLDAQEHRCRDFAKSKGYEVEKIFADTFSGGGDFLKREGMVALLDHIDKHPHKNYVVIFDDLSRFARDVSAHIKLRQEFGRRDVKILCPNFNFEDTPEGELVENIMAAQNQYHRKSNRRQVIQKQKARLERGYWPFFPPPGYQQTKDPAHGKILRSVEPRASLIKEAFEGYASGRFNSQTEVWKFLRDSGYSDSLYVEGVRRLLRRVVYAGYVERSEWEVSRRKGQHEGLISLETFEQVQARLDGIYKVRVRKTDNPDFVLRGFVLCAYCRKTMTGSWCRGRTKMYRYYRCKTNICENFNGHVRADIVDQEFLGVLRSISPRVEAIQLAKAVLLDLWGKRVKNLDDQRALLEKKLSETKRDVESLSKKIIRAVDEAVVRVYERQIVKLDEERVALEERLGKIGIDAVSFETALEAVMDFVKDPCVTWENGDLNAKRSVLRLIFADKLAFHPRGGYETAQKSLLVGMFEQITAKKSQDVEVGRIELPSRKWCTDDSTRLRVFFFV